MNWSELEKSLDSASLPEPFFVFGLHKSGSTLMHRMVGEACALARIPRLDIPGLAFKEGARPEQWGSDEALLPIFQRGMVFYGFRSFPRILLHPDLNIRGRKFVLLVRDPRDALVSQYFSFGGKHFSHVLPEKNREAFLAPVKQTADLGIDEYVLKMARGHLQRMTDYHANLDFDKGLVRRYEDAYFDKRTFLGDVFEHFELEIAPELLQRVAEKNDIRPTREDATRHVRKGTPGDYTDKLKPETISRLNEIFSGIAAVYGYDFTSQRRGNGP